MTNTSTHEFILENYDLHKLDSLCAQIWPIVNDYLIEEIDLNHELLKDSITANTLSRCIEYICTEEKSSRFRNGRSLFSVIIRLYQTNKITPTELQTAFLDNSEVLISWFDSLLNHCDSAQLESDSIRVFYDAFAHCIKTTEECNNAIERIRKRLSETDFITAKTLDKIARATTDFYKQTGLKNIGDSFNLLVEIDKISPLATEIVLSELKPEVPSPGAKRLNDMLEKHPALEGFDYNEGTHYVVEANLTFNITYLIVSCLERLPQSKLVLRLLDEFQSILDFRERKPQRLILDLEGPELFGLRSVLKMIVFLSPKISFQDPQIERATMTELETFIFTDIRNAKKI